MQASSEQQNQMVLTRINGKVYDFTKFAEIHPGGADSIRSLHNRDGTLPFLHTHGRKLLVICYQNQIRSALLLPFAIETLTHNTHPLSLNLQL